MSEEQLKAFLEAVKVDAGLQEKLKDADPDAAVAIAKEAGFVITADELQGAQADAYELSDKELEGVSGGRYVSGDRYEREGKWIQDAQQGNVRSVQSQGRK